MICLRKLGLVLATASTLLTVFPATLTAQPGMGGNIGKLRADAAEYRARVLSTVSELAEDLGGDWDDSNASKPTRYYAESATIVAGPGLVIEGRDDIRKAFASTLGKMRGVRITVIEFDMSDELAYVRGRMAYEILHDGARGTMESAAFAMTFRKARDRWFIQSHVIGGSPALPAPVSPGA